MTSFSFSKFSVFVSSDIPYPHLSFIFAVRPILVKRIHFCRIYKFKQLRTPPGRVLLVAVAVGVSAADTDCPALGTCSC